MSKATQPAAATEVTQVIELVDDRQPRPSPYVARHSWDDIAQTRARLAEHAADRTSDPMWARARRAGGAR